MQDTDSRKEQPIADVEVTADLATGAAKSDSTGLFALQLRGFVRRGHPLVLHFRQPHYLPLDVSDFVGDKLYVVHMLPLSSGGAFRDSTRSESRERSRQILRPRDD